MHPRLAHSFQRIEIQKQRLLGQVSMLSIEQLNQINAPGKWSVNQILAHLIAAEQVSVAYIKKKIQGIDSTGDSGIAEELKMLILKLSQRAPGLKFKAPPHVVETTRSYPDLKTLIEDWQKTREDFRQLLETVKEQHLKRKIYKHVSVGYLNINHAVLFFGEHVTHHTPQIKKLIKMK